MGKTPHATDSTRVIWIDQDSNPPRRDANPRRRWLPSLLLTLLLCAVAKPWLPAMDRDTTAERVDHVVSTTVPSVGHSQAVIGPAMDDGSERCRPSDSVLCLQHGRFRVDVTWQDHEGNSGIGHPAGIASEESGLLWFFRPGNWELLVKVIDGCDMNRHFWLYVAATTDVGYRLQVTDTVSGRVRVYENAAGFMAPTVHDASAFETCNFSA